MKRILVICDGMADGPVRLLDGKTPLETAHTPAMDYLACHGRCGSLHTIPPGHYPGSEIAILTILGYAPDELPEGRGPLEAAGLDITVGPRQMAMRYNLNNVTLSHSDLENIFPGYSFHPLSDTKGICISPAGICSPPSGSEEIGFWSCDTPRKYKSFASKHTGPSGGYTPSAVLIGAVPLLKGLAQETGIEWIRPDGASGNCATDYKAKGLAAIDELDSRDFVIVHIEAPDFASHQMDADAKVTAIENIDSDIVSPLLDSLRNGKDFAIAVMSDHPSHCETGCHSADSVPFLYYYKGINGDSVTLFTEEGVRSGSLKNISDIYG